MPHLSSTGAALPNYKSHAYCGTMLYAYFCYFSVLFSKKSEVRMWDTFYNIITVTIIYLQHVKDKPSGSNFRGKQKDDLKNFGPEGHPSVPASLYNLTKNVPDPYSG